MKCIKEFLKPNWWKIILFLLLSFLLLVVLFSLLSIANILRVDFPKIGCKYPTGGCERMPDGVLMCWDNFEIDSFCLSLLSKFLPIFITALIFDYLLACLIYFIITKIKCLIAKPK